MSEKGFLIILCGLPSSGKTITAQNLKRELECRFNNGISIIDTDILRSEQYGSNFSPENEILIRQTALSKTRELLSKGYIVISDDINYFESMRHEFVQIAQDLNIPFFIIYISTPLEVCLKWNKNRKTNIDDDVILRIYQKFDIPGKEYRWDVPLVEIDYSKSQNKNKIEEVIQKINENIGQKKVNKKIKSPEQEKNQFTYIENLTRKFIGFYRTYISNQKLNEDELDELTKKIYITFKNNIELNSELEIINRKLNNDFLTLNMMRKRFLTSFKTQEIKNWGIIETLGALLLFLKNNLL